MCQREQVPCLATSLPVVQDEKKGLLCAEMDGWLYRVRSCTWMRHKTKALIMVSTHQSSYHFYFQRTERDTLFPVLNQVIN